ncbi:MAG: type II secretion system F family protein [Terriglobia bacterium]|jgi:tight adherence protein B
MTLLLAALVFLIVILICAGVFTLVGGPKQGEIIRGRLEAIEKGGAFAKEALNLNVLRDELMSGIPAVNKVLVRWSWAARLRRFIEQAGMQVRPGRIVLFGAVIGLVTFEVVETKYGIFFLAMASGVTAAFLPLIYVAIKRARRLAALEKQLPEVIDLLARSVRAGHSFASGLEIISTELPDPAAAEFRITFDEQRLGLPLRDALIGLSERIPLVDIRLLVIALLVQKETGGNLAEVLDKLAHVIRERFRIAGEVRIRTAQGRLTAAVLIALPLFTMLVLRVIAPDYITTLFVDRIGQVLLIIAGVMQILGSVVIWKIVQIKV